jgi:hypothetical protein
VTGKDRSADRHDTGNQVGVAARLDRADFDRLDRLWPALGLPSRRQAIIRAIREFIDRNEETAGT